MNLLRILILVGLSLVASSKVNASIISVDSWWLQTDEHGGLRQNSMAENVYFAVAKGNFDANATYQAIEGYRFMTSQEARDILTPLIASTPRNPAHYTYHGQGGWNGYSWENRNRYLWAFSDSETEQAMMHSGHYETHVYDFSDVAAKPWRFAGFVMIKDESAAHNAIPEPQPLALLSLGMLSMLFLRKRK